MSLTLEIAPEVEAALNEVAAQHGQSANDYAAQLLADALLADALEDALDVAEADRIMANSDPTKRRSLAELRTAVFAKKVA